MLNDLTTIQFQHSTNHQGISALKQILEKRNQLEILQDQTQNDAGMQSL